MAPIWSAAARRRLARALCAAAFSSFTAALLVLYLCTAIPARAADSYTLEKLAEAPPAELPAALRDATGTDAMLVKGPGGALCEIWLRKEVPVSATPATDLGITFGQISEGTFLGVMRIAASTTDFRNQKIKPGLYTLRYSLHPVDGNHQGVAPQRDFALLAPVTEDSDPATVSRDEAIRRSTKSTGTKHPSVWSIWPGDDSATAPALRFQEDSQIWLLTFRLPLSGGARLAMGLVVAGHAPEA